MPLEKESHSILYDIDSKDSIAKKETAANNYVFYALAQYSEKWNTFNHTHVTYTHWSGNMNLFAFKFSKKMQEKSNQNCYHSKG